MAFRRLDRDPTRPVYVISVAAAIVRAHPRTLRIYEDEGLICPSRTPTNIRLYSRERHPPGHLDPAPHPGAGRQPRGDPNPLRARGAPRDPDPRSPLRRGHGRGGGPVRHLRPTFEPHIPRGRHTGRTAQETMMARRPSSPADEKHKNAHEVRELPLVALRETVIFPEMIVPLQVGREKSVNALNAAVAEGGPIALVTQRPAEQEDISNPSELFGVGTLAKIAQVVQLPTARSARSSRARAGCACTGSPRPTRTSSPASRSSSTSCRRASRSRR